MYKEWFLFVFVDCVGEWVFVLFRCLGVWGWWWVGVCVCVCVCVFVCVYVCVCGASNFAQHRFAVLEHAALFTPI